MFTLISAVYIVYVTVFVHDNSMDPSVSGSHAGSFRDPTCAAGGRGGPGEPGGSDGTGRQA